MAGYFLYYILKDLSLFWLTFAIFHVYIHQYNASAFLYVSHIKMSHAYKGCQTLFHRITGASL